jgi:hypothetical protein
MAVKNYEPNKNTATSGKLIKAVCAAQVCVSVFCASYAGQLEYNSLFVRLGGGGGYVNVYTVGRKSD